MDQPFRKGRRPLCMVCRSIRTSTVVSWASGYHFLISTSRRRSRHSSSRSHNLLLQPDVRKSPAVSSGSVFIYLVSIYLSSFQMNLWFFVQSEKEGATDDRHRPTTC